jgi:hypothetical protein
LAKAAKNVSKAAEVLHLFIDDSIDLQLPFATVRQQALSLLTKRDLESVCLFLNEQRRSVDEAMWAVLRRERKSAERFAARVVPMSALRRLRRHPALSGRLGENTKRTQRRDAQLQTADTRLLSKNHVNGVLGIFRPKTTKVLWRPRRLWPPEGYYFFRDPYLGSV